MSTMCYAHHRGKWEWMLPQVASLCAWDKMHACEQKSAIWLQRRKLRLTASQIATAIGINPYETRNNLIKQYAGVGSGETKFTGNEATRHGEFYEDDAVSLYEQRYQKTVLMFGLMPFIAFGEFLGGSVDGVTTDGILVEVKCPYRRQPKTDSIPAYYEPQIQSMMHGFSLKCSAFIEYVPTAFWTPEIFNVHQITRDVEFMNTHYPSLREFWYRVSLCRQGLENGLYDDRVHTKRKRPHLPKPLMIEH